MRNYFKRISAMIIAVLLLTSQVVVPAFAVNTGDSGYCSVCGDDGIIGALQHSLAPTCGADGFDIYACDNGECEGTVTIRVKTTGQHTGDGNVVAAEAPTCTEPGSVAYEICTGCGCYLEPGTSTKLDTIVDPATGHDHIGTVTDPDCVNGGYTTYVCSVCGDTYTGDKCDALGHDYSKVIAGKDATCREEGYTSYKECRRCGEMDPDNSKEIIPMEDHNGKFVERKDPTCENEGHNIFKCEKSTCPYYNGVTEVIPALGHDVVEHDAVEADCENAGYGAYETCTRCDYSTYDETTEVNALGHTTVNKGYVAPTCTDVGMTDAVVCDRCGLVHHKGEEIPATGHTPGTPVEENRKEATCTEDGSYDVVVYCTVCEEETSRKQETIDAKGHTLTEVSAITVTCTEDGRIAHKTCSVCKKNYASTSVSNDPDAVEVTNVVINKLGHKYHLWTDAPSCTEAGYNIYTCEREIEGKECGHTYSEVINATGHDFEYVEEIPAKCEKTGTKAHNKCTVCNKLFAADVAEKDITAAPIAAADLVISALDHVGEAVSGTNPTYNVSGNESGEKCNRCGKALKNAGDLAELEENVKFHYVISGVNGASDAVNSGYVTLEIYFDILKDDLDKAEYNSDVLANIFAVDFAMDFDKNVFELTHVLVAPGAFTKAQFTPLDKANKDGVIAITQDMVDTSKVFRGDDNLFATLTFQVDPEAVAGTYSFNKTVLNVVHPDSLDANAPDYEEINISASETVIEIDVQGLGDANSDGMFTSADTLAVSNFIKNADEGEYIAKYDLDKDGSITFFDLDLIRKAIVGNEEYKTIIVDPNAVTEPEV